MDSFEPVPPAVSGLLGSLYPIIATTAWLGAIAAAWKRCRMIMGALIGIAALASAATLVVQPR